MFVLILNSIRALYFEHAAALRVAARPHELAPAYAEAAEAVARGDADRARAVVDALAERQRERVEEALGREHRRPEPARGEHVRLHCRHRGRTGRRPPAAAPYRCGGGLRRRARGRAGTNRALLRALLYAVEAAPLLLGYGARLRRLGPDARTEALERLEAGPAGQGLRPLTALASPSMTAMDGASRALGYDADAVVARGRALRQAEVRW